MKHYPYLLDVIGISTKVLMSPGFTEDPEAYAGLLGISALDVKKGTKRQPRRHRGGY